MSRLDCVQKEWIYCQVARSEWKFIISFVSGMFPVEVGRVITKDKRWVRDS